MAKGLRILAVLMLVATVLGAFAVLYAMNTLAPQVIEVTPVVTPAADAQEMFDKTLKDCANGLFKGSVYGDALSLNAADCAFVTYTVRLENKGFFPAEWIALHVYPAEGDVLMLENAQANVLAAGAQGDLSATILTAAPQPLSARTIEITCYVFGRKQTVRVQTN